MKKRLFLVVLALVVLIGALTLTASAATEVASGSCGPNLTWSLSSNGVLTISGTGAMTDYDYDGGPWAGYRDRITAVILPNGLTSIGSSAFYGLYNLTSASIPDSVTRIGGWAFFECSSLTSVEIPDKVTALGNSTFAFCSSLASVYINSDFSGNHNTFHECSKLTTLHIGPKVTRFYQNFLNNLYALTTVKVDAGNSTYSAQNGFLLSKNGKTLIYCPLGKSGSLTVPNGVTTIGEDAFYYCNKLTSVTLPGSVTTIGKEAFLHCTGLTSVNLSKGLTAIDEYAFYGCNRLTSVEISNSLQELQNFAFYESGLKDLYFDGTEKEWKQLLSTGSDQLPSGATVHWKVVEPVKKPPLPSDPIGNSSQAPAGANSGGIAHDRHIRNTGLSAVVLSY